MLSSLCLFNHFFTIISSRLKSLYYECRLWFFSNFFSFSKSFVNDLFLSDLFKFLRKFLEIHIFFKFLIKLESLIPFISFWKLQKNSSLCSFIHAIVKLILFHERVKYLILNVNINIVVDTDYKMGVELKIKYFILIVDLWS